MNISIQDEEWLKAMILCDPITKKGKKDLAYLQQKNPSISLSANEFFDHLRVPSIYDRDRKYADVVVPGEEKEVLLLNYTVDEEQYEAAQSQYKDFIDSITKRENN